jgi:16S rRNA (uracil1498-N3)-methyltransferase
MQRYFSETKNDNKLLLNDSDFHHIYKVMRMKNNDQIEVVCDKKVYVCNLEDNYGVIIKEIESNNVNKEINLVIPVLKEAKMDLIIQKATELGVSNIYVIKTERSIVKVDLKEDKKISRWQTIAKEASEQSKRIDIPKIRGVLNIKDLKEIDGIKLVCSTKERVKTLQNLLHNNFIYDKITIVVGPEGGLSDKEESLLNELGFLSISLGKLIMRVETVPIYILSVLNFMNME